MVVVEMNDKLRSSAWRDLNKHIYIPFFTALKRKEQCNKITINEINNNELFNVFLDIQAFTFKKVPLFSLLYL